MAQHKVLSHVICGGKLVASYHGVQISMETSFGLSHHQRLFQNLALEKTFSFDISPWDPVPLPMGTCLLCGINRIGDCSQSPPFTASYSSSWNMIRIFVWVIIWNKQRRPFWISTLRAMKLPRRGSGHLVARFVVNALSKAGDRIDNLGMLLPYVKKDRPSSTSLSSKGPSQASHRPAFDPFPNLRFTTEPWRLQKQEQWYNHL